MLQIFNTVTQGRKKCERFDYDVTKKQVVCLSKMSEQSTAGEATRFWSSFASLCVSQGHMEENHTLEMQNTGSSLMAMGMNQGKAVPPAQNTTPLAPVH